MNKSIFRLQDNVPEIYPNQSRDFQLLCRAFDLWFNSTKYNVDSVGRVTDTYTISNSLLELLQTKVGFYSNKNISDDDLRYILKAFPSLIKNKGSKLGILQSIYLFLKLKHLDTNIYVNTEGTIDDPHVIQIGIHRSQAKTSKESIYTTSDKISVDFTILYEILNYILPTGYILDIFIFEKSDQVQRYFYNDSVKWIVLNSKPNQPISVLKVKRNQLTSADIDSKVNNLSNANAYKMIDNVDTSVIYSPTEEDLAK